MPGLLIFGQGGYNLDSISKSALAVTRTLLGEPPDRIEKTRPTKSGAATVDMVRVYQRRFWPCLASDPKSSTKGESWDLRVFRFPTQECPEGTMHGKVGLRVEGKWTIDGQARRRLT